MTISNYPRGNDFSDLVKMGYQKDLKLIDKKAGLLSAFDKKNGSENTLYEEYQKFYGEIIEIKNESEIESLIKQGYELVK